MILQKTIAAPTTESDATAARKPFMTIKETAAYLDLSVAYMYQLTWRNAIPYYKPTGKKVYFDVDEINAWVKSNRISTDAEISDRAMAYLKTK